MKICGITRPEDAAAAGALGADAIGLVFYKPSPRAVSIERALEIVDAVPAFVTVVGLFVNAAASDVRATLSAVPVDVLQFHGDEPPEYCVRFRRRYIKAVSMRKGVDLPAYTRRYATAAALLLDTYHENKPGGVGRPFDWSLVTPALDKPVVLAGGLTAENVAQAIEHVRPHAVDVSGGVEADKGIKDAAKMAALIQEVRGVEFGDEKD